MLPAKHWAHSFSISAEDIDYITNLLLEKETPLSSTELAIAIVRQRLEEKRAEIKAQYEGTTVYRPANSYAIGDRLLFSTMDYATATITDIRDGLPTDDNGFKVASVQFDKARYNLPNRQREFAIEYTTEHPLNDEDVELHPANLDENYTPEQIINDPNTTIMQQVDKALTKNKDLVRISGTWFVRDLMMR